jgi:hypothetical protein
MVIFATPDFGASGGISLMLIAVWAVVLIVALAGFIRARILLERGSLAERKRGTRLLIVCGLIPLFCCLCPPQVVRITYGNYPISSSSRDKVKEGMSADEVRALLGRPHEASTRQEGEFWYYWLDSYSISWFCVRFGSDGHVVGTHGN